MTLDEYEVFFIQEKNRRKNRMKLLIFIAGMIAGQIIGVTALALVSVNRNRDI